jgi:type IV secretory pathway VirB6-like protein
VTLIKAFVGIIIDAVLGPLFIAFSVVPGKKAVRSDWLKRLIKNALTFPLVYFFLNLSSLVFSNSISISLPTDLTGGTSSAGGAVGAIMQMAISIYLIYLAAESPKFIDEFLPVSGGKSTSAALQEAAKGSFGKIPLLGTFVK